MQKRVKYTEMRKLFYTFSLLAVIILSSVIGCSTENIATQDVQATKTIQNTETTIPIKPSEEISSSSEEKQQTPNLTTDLDLSGNSFSILFIGMKEEPYASINKSLSLAVEDAVSFINASGGILGAEIELYYVSFEGNEESLEEFFRESTRRFDPLVVLMAAPINDELSSVIQGARIPVLYFGLGGKALERPEISRDYIFWLTPLPDDQFAFFLDQAWRQWEGIRPPGNMNEFRIGYITWEEPPNDFAITPRIEAFYQRQNFDFVIEGRMKNSSNSSLTNFLLQSITSGMTVLYTDTFSYGPMVLLNDVYSLGLNDFFVLGGSVWSYDPSSAHYLISPEATHEFYLPLPTLWWSEKDQPAIIKANTIMDQSNRSGEEKNFAYLLGLASVDISAHVLRKAVTATNDGDITPSTIYAQLSILETYPVLEGLYEIDYSNHNRSPKMMRLWMVSPGNRFIPVGDIESVPELIETEDQ